MSTPLTIDDSDPSTIPADEQTESEAEYTGPLYLTKLTINNFKIIQFVEIDAETGEPIIIAGDNAQGKSTVMDATKALFFGKDACPGEPIRRGKNKSEIKGHLSNGQTVLYTVTRKFTKTGGTTLSVERTDGGEVGPAQQFLTSLVGGVKKADDSIAFDPTILIDMDAKKQDEILRKACDVDFSDLNAKHKQLYDQRTAKNKEAEKAAGDAERMPFHKGLPDKEVSFTDALADLAAREEKQRANDALSKKHDQHISDIQAEREQLVKINDAVQDCERQIAELQQRLVQLADAGKEALKNIADGDAAIAELGQQVAALVDPNIAEAKETIATLEQKNREIRANTARREALDRARKLADESEALTEQLKELDAEKARRLERADFPIPGLGFDDLGPTFNGLPLDQASTAQLIQLGAALAEQLRPRLRLLLVRRGGDLGPTARKVLFDLCQAKGYRCWLEEVNLTGEGATILMEAGEARRM
jgi:DNA repair exonuclease SbcCD ATPase subunit